jgi:hypothetical protein
MNIQKTLQKVYCLSLAAIISAFLALSSPTPADPKGLPPSRPAIVSKLKEPEQF